ncbi:hypothetical protein QNO07_20125 [Streptomyces sp. 549]|uniref:hypothetical protein n=1 Tax=Streptomyces sp. 549 TaxID=3049076 RepID=UPI0024C44508|nr:hypothetical protein [Streptomyces sp. 549]MDK1475696.1 hypothetical protein [Streptomyces sp. 549]
MSPQRTPNTRLRALLGEAEWTQEALARAVNSLAAEIGTRLRYDRTTVAHWLAGTEPRRPAAQFAAEALSRRLARPVTPLDAGFHAPAAGPPAADPVAGFTALCRSDSDPAHRGPLHQRPYRVAEAITALSPPPRRPGRPRQPVPGREAPGSLAALEDAARFFATSMDSHGGRNARTALCAYLADDVSPMLRHPLPARAEAPLLSAAGRLTFVLGRMYEDGRLHGLAQHYYGYAHRLAHEAGDRVTWTQVVRAMSAQALRLDHRETALRLAEAAVGAASATPPAVRAFAHSQAAVARATAGDRRGSVEAMATAERFATRADCDGGDGGGDPFTSYPAAALSYQASAALEALGDVPAALAALRRSVIERAPGDVRGRALTRARFAEVLLRAGRLEEAFGTWRDFADDHPSLRSGEADRAAERMCRLLVPYRAAHPAAAALLARAPGAARGRARNPA